MAKKLYFRGLEVDELKKMDYKSFVDLIPSRARRLIKNGLTEPQKKFMAKVQLAKEGKYKKEVKTHCRSMIVTPEMLDLIIHVHNGKDFAPVHVTHEKLGHRLGEFALTRKSLKHSSPGIGATKGTASASVK
jgi:small subunit ribosomal protein S19